MKVENINENNENKNINEINDIKLEEMKTEVADISVTLPLQEALLQKKKKVRLYLSFVYNFCVYLSFLFFQMFLLI